MKKKSLRVRVLTDRPAQAKYLGLLMVSMLVPLICAVGCLYYLIFTILAEQLGIPESIAINLFPVIRKINMILLVGMPPIILVLLGWGIVLSHRFVGPLERLESEVVSITKSGDYARRIRVRKGDDIRPVADVINRLLDAIESKRR